MGGHYGSIHVRTDDRDGVRSAVESLVCERTTRFLIAPSIDGWVTVFPEHNGQDSIVSEALAAKLPDKTLIHCLVHDDDVFAYWVFEGGRIIDTYNSCPSYFGDSNPPPRGGNAAALSHLLLDPSKAAELQALLDAERFAFELERQDQFAALLGLPNTASAYEYLQSGETGGVKQWKKFIHVPDPTLEKSARRAATAAERAELKRLQREKILLVDEVAKRSSNKHFYGTPCWAVDPDTSTAFLIWQDYPLARPTSQKRLRVSPPDWQFGPWLESSLPLINAFTFSNSGSFLAMATSGGDLEIWDRREQRVTVQKQFAGRVNAMRFSPDEAWLFAIVYGGGSTQLQRIALRSGLQDATFENGDLHFQGLTLHPSGRLLAAVDTFGVLVVIDVASMRIVNQTWIKEQNPLMPEEMREAIIADAMDKMMGEMGKHLPENELKQYHRRSARHFLPKEPIRLCCFTPEGDWLFCGTSGGLRGIRWDQVLACPDMEAVQVHLSVDAEAMPSGARGEFGPPQKLVYGLSYDSECRRILFSGLEGKISFVNLESRQSGTLLESPGRTPLIELELTPDRAALVATAHPFDFENNKQKPSRFQVWNYAALCRAAGLEH